MIPFSMFRVPGSEFSVPVHSSQLPVPGSTLRSAFRVPRSAFFVSGSVFWFRVPHLAEGCESGGSWLDMPESLVVNPLSVALL